MEMGVSVFWGILKGDTPMKKLNLIAFGLAILLFGGFLFIQFDLKSDLKNLEFSNVSAEQVPNGIYEGRSSIGPVKVLVQVKVSDGKIDVIELKHHKNGMGTDAEALLRIMEKTETWDVDCVTGATISSHAIRQAVNRALQSGLQAEG